MSTLYDAALLAAAQNTTWATPPAHTTHEARVRSALCADDITLSLRVEQGRIVDIGWSGDACAVCRASAHVLCGVLHNQPVSAVSQAATQLDRALHTGSSASVFEVFRCVQAHPSRYGCARLPHQAAKQALSSVSTIEAPSPPPPSVAAASTAWQAALAYRRANLHVVLATLVSVEGSSPCPLGSHMVVAESGAFWGSVSGGCVESAVVQAALRMLRDGSEPALLSYQISNSQAGAVGLPCGGQIRVVLMPGPADALLVAAEQAEIGTLACYPLSGGGLELTQAVPNGVDTEALEQCGGVVVEVAGKATFIEPLGAEPVLVLIGGTHVAQKLAALALTVGLKVVLVEPREGFASAERFPGVQVIRERPERCLPGLLSARSSVVTLTHTAALDDASLRAALASDARYVGALGSRKTQAARLERLRAAGLAEAQLARIHGPAGLPIGGVGAGEIALSILGEVVARRRRAEPTRFGAVVLAAGSSTRAGPVNKLLQPLHGVPLLRHTVVAVVESGVHEVVVVLGHQAAAVREALAGLPVAFVENVTHERGMGSSIATGVRALQSTGVAATFIVLGDMPFVRAHELRTLMAAHTPSTQHLVVVPVAGTDSERRRGNPVLWPRPLFPELMALRGDTGGRSIIAAAPGIVLPVPVEHLGVLRDVDHALTE